MSFITNFLKLFEDKWNNGVCKCGKGFWKSFDMDSSGAVGYKCTHCDNIIWR